MQTLKIKFDNYYDIKKLQKDFDFSTGKVFSLYAPNGSMKTSFAKTFKNFSSETETKDSIFTELADSFVLRNLQLVIAEKHYIP
jgi:hypothetical protein